MHAYEYSTCTVHTAHVHTSTCTTLRASRAASVLGASYALRAGFHRAQLYFVDLASEIVLMCRQGELILTDAGKLCVMTYCMRANLNHNHGGVAWLLWLNQALVRRAWFSHKVLLHLHDCKHTDYSPFIQSWWWPRAEILMENLFYFLIAVQTPYMSRHCVCYEWSLKKSFY